MRRLAAYLLPLILMVAALPMGAAYAEDGLDVAIARRLAADEPLLVDAKRLDVAKLRLFYARRGFVPAWFADGAADPVPEAWTLLKVVSAADAEGLEADDYHPESIAMRLGETRSGAATMDEAQRAELDLVLTDALIGYALDLHQGRVTPRLVSNEFAVTPDLLDPVAAGSAAVAANDLRTHLAALAPVHSGYARLREALARYRAIEKAGGWPVLPDGPKMRPGLRDATVQVLRRRLMATGDLDPKTPLSNLYDAAVKKAVERFQARHGLDVDGMVGAASRVALNVPVAERIGQIIANMERMRWLPADLGERHVVVNIPGFMLQAMDKGKVALEMPVIVGTVMRRTPILSSRITSVVLNPTWTVPRKLAREDILPKLQKDRNYLAQQGISVYADWGADARPLRPSEIDWKGLSYAINRYRLRQDPGPHNALGQVKFNIPNDFDVYLHDTPHREKFDKTVRTFSSGCVRVGNPMALVDFLLKDMEDWPVARRKEALDTGKTRYVFLRSPVPVHLLYQTAWVDDQHTVQFREDIYGRDAELLKGIARYSRPPQRVAAIRVQ